MARNTIGRVCGEWAGLGESKKDTFEVVLLGARSRKGSQTGER
jgi:hypothetical protein